MNPIDTFTEYGQEFQMKALAAFISDKDFFTQVADEIKPSYFDGESLKWILETIIEYHKQYRDVPSKEVFRAEILGVSDTRFQDGLKSSIVQVYEYLNSSDHRYIKEHVNKFCQNQAVRNAIVDSVDDVARGQYEPIRNRISKALMVGIDTSLGYDYQEEFNERYEDDIHNPIATPWQAVNDVTKGGPGAGHLCVVLAPPGVGKTWVLVQVGSAALRQGKTVLHYTLELNAHYVGRRYDTMLTGVHIDHLADNPDEVRQILETENRGKLYIKRHYSRGVSTDGIRGHVEKCTRLGGKPDMVIVDYADLLRLPGKGDLRHQIEQMYEELREIAGEYDIPIWTASQTNRDGSTEEFIDGQFSAEAFSKNNTPDFIISYSRPEKYRSQKTGFGFIVKNRLGPDKLKFIGPSDPENGVIDLYPEDSNEARNTIRSGVQARQEHDREIANKLSNSNTIQRIISRNN